LRLADQLPKLAPDVEYLQLPYLPEFWKPSDRVTVDAMIARITMLKKLRMLSFTQWPVTDEHMHQLAALDQLQVIQVGHSSRLTDRAFDAFREMKQLRYLTIYDGVSNEAVEEFHKDRPEVIMHINGVSYGDHSLLFGNPLKKGAGS
jgi:hypothetical protein